jgi:hypothetical protein
MDMVQYKWQRTVDSIDYLLKAMDVAMWHMITTNTITYGKHLWNRVWMHFVSYMSYLIMAIFSRYDMVLIHLSFRCSVMIVRPLFKEIETFPLTPYESFASHPVESTEVAQN